MPSALQPCLHPLEVRGRLVGEVVAELRRGVEHVLPVVALRVEDPQRVGLGPLAISSPSSVGVAAPVVEQHRRDSAPRLVGVAHRVDEQPRRRAARDRGRSRAASAMTSTSTSGSSTPRTSTPTCQCWRYRPFCGRSAGSWARGTRPSTASAGWCCDERPHDRRGALGAQREPAAAPVVELVHLLAHDVGGLTDPLEHLRVLEDRRQQQAVSEAPGPVGEPGDELLPAVGLGRQHVAGPVGRAENVSVARASDTSACYRRSPAAPEPFRRLRRGRGAGRFSSPARIPGRSVNFGALLPMNRGQQR